MHEVAIDVSVIRENQETWVKYPEEDRNNTSGYGVAMYTWK